MPPLDESLEMLLKILGVLIPIMIGLGFRLAGVFGNREGEVLRRFVVRFTVPVLVFFSMYGSQRSEIGALPTMMGAIVLLTAFMFPAGYLASKAVRGAARKGAVHACCIFGNYGWLGYAVMQVLLGDTGFRRAVFFCTLWWPVFYGFGLPVGLIHTSGRKGSVPLRKALEVAAPVLCALAAGLALNLTGLKWSERSVFRVTLENFGEMTVPLILFSVGVELDLKGLRRAVGPALLVSGVRLVVCPAIGWAVATIMTRDATSFAVVVLQAAMPVATITPVLAESFEMDVDVASTSIVLSTILSMLTLPVVAYLALPV